VNLDGRFGRWSYALLRDRATIAKEINSELNRLSGMAVVSATAT